MSWVEILTVAIASGVLYGTLTAFASMLAEIVRDLDDDGWP